MDEWVRADANGIAIDGVGSSEIVKVWIWICMDLGSIDSSGALFLRFFSSTSVTCCDLGTWKRKKRGYSNIHMFVPLGVVFCHWMWSSCRWMRTSATVCGLLPLGVDFCHWMRTSATGCGLLPPDVAFCHWMWTFCHWMWTYATECGLLPMEAVLDYRKEWKQTP